MKRSRTVFDKFGQPDATTFAHEYGTLQPPAKHAATGLLGPSVAGQLTTSSLSNPPFSTIFAPDVQSASSFTLNTATPWSTVSAAPGGTVPAPFGRSMPGFGASSGSDTTSGLASSLSLSDAFSPTTTAVSGSVNDSFSPLAMSFVEDREVVALRRLLQPLLPGPGAHFSAATPTVTAHYPMHTWVISSRLLLAVQPRLYVAVLDCSSAFVLHIGEFALPAAELHSVAGLLGFTTSTHFSTASSTEDVRYALDIVRDSVEAAYASSLTTALGTMVELVRSISAASNMPSQPLHVARDGSEPLTVPGLWMQLTERFASLLAAEEATGGGTAGLPMPQPVAFGRMVSAGMGIPFHHLSLESPKPFESGAESSLYGDDEMLGTTGIKACLAQKLMDNFVAHWNVRAERPLHAAGTGVGTSSSPRLRLLSFYHR